MTTLNARVAAIEALIPGGIEDLEDLGERITVLETKVFGITRQIGEGTGYVEGLEARIAALES